VPIRPQLPGILFVCSDFFALPGDLLVPIKPQLFGILFVCSEFSHLFGDTRHLQGPGCACGSPTTLGTFKVQIVPADPPDHACSLYAEEIGRASCRERV
jgi:hypothetical protein